MRRNTATALLCICLTAALVPAHAASDPAAVGGSRYDPAFVDGRASPPPADATDGDPTPGGETASPATDETLANIDALLKQVRTELRNGGSVDASALQRDRASVDALARAQWDALGPRTRLRYADAFDRASPADARDTGTHATGGEIDDRRVAHDPDGTLRGLEALLVPMLQDLQRAADAKLASPRIEH